MRASSICFTLGTILVGALLCPLHVAAQPFVYVDDNNSAAGGNTASGFALVSGGNALASIGSFATTGTGIGMFPPSVQEVAANISGSNCLFVSDPLATTLPPFPTGDVAAFTIGSGGALTLVGNFYDPTNTASYNHVIPLAIDRRPGFPYLFAAFSGENKIVFFKVATNCQLVWVSSTLATSPAGASVLAIAVSRAWAHIVVVTYGDGYVQSFNIVGGTLTPNPVVLGTGLPQGVDITRNGRWAVFGDWQTGGTQVEVSPIALSGTLGPLVNNILVGGTDSRNVWLSPGTVGGNPNNFYLYVTNKASGQVSTFKINQVSGAITLLGPCPPGYTVTTTLFNPGTWIYPAGLHTTATGGAGTRLVVAEYGVPSSVSLLKINGPTGCMKELVSTGSPFPDPSSNNGLESIDVFPSRPY